MEVPDGSSAGTGPAAGRRRFRKALVAGAVLGLAVAGLGVAAAQTETPEGGGGTAPEAEQTPAPGPGEKRPGARGFGPRGLGPKAFGRSVLGLGAGAIHGEFTVPGPGGGFQTLATQVGEVVSVSSSRIEVRSEDGFTRAYALTEDTLVKAGRDGIDDVATGDTVRILAVVADGDARAVRVVDQTRVRELTERWRPGRR